MPNDIKKLRRLMRTANQIKKEHPAILRGASLTQSQALKYAWWFEAFRKKLQTGTYRFSYFKTDGSIREAVGTLCMDFMPEDKRPKGDMSDSAAREPNPDVFPYYDINAGGWRSFRLDNFIGFVAQV
jgi:hypothetical protein